MEITNALLTLEEAKKYTDENTWLQVTLPPRTTVNVHVEASSTYFIVFGGGTDFKEISIIFTGTDGTPSHREVFGDSRYTITTDTPYQIGLYSDAPAATRYCYLFNLAKTATPYIVS